MNDFYIIDSIDVSRSHLEPASPVIANCSQNHKSALTVLHGRSNAVFVKGFADVLLNVHCLSLTR